MIFQDYKAGEEMLTFLPMVGRTGEDIYHAFENVYFRNKFTLLLPMKIQLRLLAWMDLLKCAKPGVFNAWPAGSFEKITTNASPDRCLHII
jgi:hypothetical protein